MKCPRCGEPVRYRKWYLGRHGWWCDLCYDWTRPTAVKGKDRRDKGA